MLRLFVVLMISPAALAAFALAPHAQQRALPVRPQQAPQLETPSDPAAPAQPPAGPVGPGGVVRRGRHVSVQVNVNSSGKNTFGDAGNEPSMAINPLRPNQIVIGWRQFDTVTSNFRQAGYGYSSDFGRTWTFPGVLEPGVFRSDPVLDADADGNIYYLSLGITPDFHTDIFISPDGGRTWGAPRFAIGGDKQWFVIDRTDGVSRGNVYQAWSTAGNPSFPRQFAMSQDAGQTWLGPGIIPAFPVWGTLAVGGDGTLFLGGLDFGAGLFVVARSTTVRDPAAGQDPNSLFTGVTVVDLGGSLGLQASPNPAGLLGQTWVATDTSGTATDGNVYLLASVDPNSPERTDVRFSRSEDGGVSFSEPVRVNDDPPGTAAWQWFGTMSVAPNGRIDVIFNDTRNSGLANISEMFYANSIDGGRTWSRNVPVTPAWDSWVGWPDQEKIGDYYDSESDENGVNIAYAATFNGEQDVYFLRINVGPCAADLNFDGQVDLADLAQTLAAFGRNDSADLDDDGDTDLEDLSLMLAAFGISCR